MIDRPIWNAAEHQETRCRLELERAADRWHEIENFLFEP